MHHPTGHAPESRQPAGRDHSHLRSDNRSGICRELLAAIAAANTGPAEAYGGDRFTGRLPERFASVFGVEPIVLPVLTGTAANALAMSSLQPFSEVLCHDQSHMLRDEAGAVEAQARVRLVGVAGADGKLTVEALERACAVRRSSGTLRSTCVSIAQPTELGTVYCVDEIAAISRFAHERDMPLHMDGARLANAVAAMDRDPADVTWRSGVDVLSFGATKNGALAAEAVVFFTTRLADGVPEARKRAGQTASKMRFVSAQLLACLADGLWLRNAAAANACARLLAAGLEAIEGVRLLAPVETNQVFADLPSRLAERLNTLGLEGARWGPPGCTTIRLVTSFDTSADEVEALLHDLN